jgi:hypothetical protein
MSRPRVPKRGPAVSEYCEEAHQLARKCGLAGWVGSSGLLVGSAIAVYRLGVERLSQVNIDYDLATPAGRLEFAKDALGSRCPDPTIVKEQKVHLWTGLVSVDKYTADIKCHPAV